ncbi:sucrose-specific PTS transporter subunit IIBC [Geobacillus stearothermophilus]|uniref:sucrose-specific PTS transporter subunit IIBC n=1 Tax=Geobacillus stearothermophilus TaxID=1422 RepID=UPI000518A582|nr:sucrose-specific PTS transporter subunit IIBC [Geobacillus stearothermophilus]KOR94110.1 PTS system sucrose-specific transporter subuits IIBC [Geobacillus stearothermophilus ATCC 12980]MED3664301.1 sucrose-specific PTS transporter subunit IIBC [Geobacillus stearothermophilus]MED3720616.1 sucrose-specific PTS transporter subunit IIBC [Geobacillus stearothermophilus]MED3723193.1 sucrose-specific PTS transporter subunit IIBC [Geobacillus stearothermophilus]MED3731056.1 sucrose-specific PTS tra
MNYEHIAKQLIPLLGGKENIISVTHCATRLRLVLKDDKKAEAKDIENIEGVKGAFSSSGQFQIIFGTGVVNKVYEAFVREAGIQQGDADAHQEAIKQKMNPLARFAKTLSNIFVPIIPAIVASGLLMGLLGMMKAFKWVAADSPLYILLDMFSSAAFIILPILIGFSAAKEFGGTPFLGAVIGGIMTHPALLNPWGLAEAKPKYMHFLGFDIAMVGYQGTVVPILLATYVMSKVERGLRKVVPHAVSLLVVPFVTVILTGFITILAIGPLGNLLGDGITKVLNFVYHYGGALAGLIFGGLYSMIVITGVHHSFHAIEANLLAKLGVNYLLPIWSMANVAQGGAGLAVFVKSKRTKTKEIALPAALSAFLGITEPVIFGVNLKYRKPFIAAAIGGALGGAYVVFTNVVANAYGLTGIPMIAIVAPEGLTNLMHYLIGFAIAVVSAFVATFLLKFREEEE